MELKPLYFAIAGLCILYLIHSSGKEPQSIPVQINATECETIKWMQFGRVQTVYLCQDTLNRTVHYHSLQAVSNKDFAREVKPVLDSLMIDLYTE